jgi:hypothetical protein
MASITRAQAIQTLEDGQRRLEALFDQLTDDQLVRPATIGGGDWSAKDLMGHAARWNEIAIEALASWRDGAMPWIEGQWSGGVDQVNADNYELSRYESVDRARSRLRQSHDALVGAIRAMSHEEWHSTAPYETERRSWLGMLLGGITGAPKRAFGHAFAHLGDLEAYVAGVKELRHTPDVSGGRT